MSTAPSLPPPLRPGERLTREEFLRRWDLEPDLKRAELIDGTVYMPSPLSHAHGVRDGCAMLLLGYYSAYTPGTEAGSNATWLMQQSAPQPDVYLRLLPEFGGRSHVERGLCAGVPELVVEVCQSSAAYDLGPKLRLYQRAGVQEYVTAVLQEEQVIWRSLVGGVYQPLQVGTDGLLRSLVFPGLWLDPAAFLAGDKKRVLAVAESGLASPEHQEFAARLSAGRT